MGLHISGFAVLAALTAAGLTVEGNAYFPRASLVEEHFEASTHTTVCGWKGTANYLSVVAGGERNVVEETVTIRDDQHSSFLIRAIRVNPRSILLS